MCTTYEFNDGSVRLGSHVSKLSTLVETIFRVVSWKINCAQIYIASSRGYSIPTADKEDMKLVWSLSKYACFPVYVHGCLLYNLNGGTHIDNIDELIANAKTDKQREKYEAEKEKIPISQQKTIQGLVAELDICAQAFGTGVVCHIGSGAIKDKALKRIGKTINEVLTIKTNIDPKKRRLILENAAGEGNKIGKTLQEIADILNFVKEPLRDQVLVCIDTCHLYAAGDYDIEKVSEVKRFLKDFKRLIGLNKLYLIHLNDSKKEFGCKVDRHENLGKGCIYSSDEGKEALTYLVQFCNKRKIDMILETPGDHFEDIDLVYSRVK